MTRNQLPAHPTSHGINRAGIALQLIQLGDNMRLRDHLGQPPTHGQIQTYNHTADQWDRFRIPRQRGKEQAR